MSKIKSVMYFKILHTKNVIYIVLLFCSFSCKKINCPKPLSQLNSTPTTPAVVIQNSLSKGLIASYSFCGNANDGSGNFMDGTIHGGVTPAADRFGNANSAYYFDGVDDYIDIKNAALFTPTQWTYSAWINITSNPLTNTNAFIIALGGTGEAQALAINNAYTQNSQGFIASSYHAPANTPTICILNTLPTLDRWYHVVGVRETDTLRLFIDGVQVVKTKTLSADISYGGSSFYANIAARQNGSELFNGYMDDIRIYSRPLSANEVSELYTSTTTCPALTLQDGLLAKYDFCGNANDASGNNINGIVHGGAVLSADRFGNANSAYYFDGIDDYIDIYNPLLFNSTQWTYSAWVNVTTNPDPGAIAYIIGIGGGGSGGAQDLLINNQYVIPYQGFETNTYHIAGQSVSYSISGTLPVTDQWYHVVGIRELDTVRIYVNGIEIAKNKTASNVITYGTASSAFIGARAAGTRLFNGFLDDIKIYSRPLSADEVKELYTSTSSCSAVTAKYRLLAYNDFGTHINDGTDD